MKYIRTILSCLLLTILLSFTLCACGQQTQSTEPEPQQAVSLTEEPETAGTGGEAAPEMEDNTVSEPVNGKTLVVVFSATGHTEPLAEAAAAFLGADLYEIVPEEPYTDEDLNYNDSTTRATVEQNTPDARPAISGMVENMEQYDTVIIAHPIWWGKEPKIIDTFLESYDFTGKTMTSMCTSASSGIGTAESNLHKAVPNATWLDSRRFAIGADTAEVEQWLREIGLA